MGADLIASVLETGLDTVISFDKAREVAKNMSLPEIQDAYSFAHYSEGYADFKNSNNDPTPVDTEESAREYVLGVISEVEDMWNGNCRNAATINLRNTKILVTGDMSYGDCPDGVQTIESFVQLSLHTEAGFYE